MNTTPGYKKKYILVIIFFLFASKSLPAQDTINNFFINENEIIWQKIYSTSVSFDNLFMKFKEKGILKNQDSSNHKIVGNIVEIIDTDYKGAGYTVMNMPVVLSSSHIDAFYIIEYKPGRYRVSLKKIVFIQASDMGRPGQILYSQKGEKTEIETYYYKKGAFTNTFKKAPSIILDYTFSKLFELKEELQNQEW